MDDFDEITAVLPLSSRRPSEMPPASVDATLEIVSGKDEGKIFHLSAAHSTLGREEGVEVHLDDPSLSRRHARVWFEGHEFRVADLDSANGTFLNGSRVVEYALRDGDKLLVGETLLVFRVAVGANS